MKALENAIVEIEAFPSVSFHQPIWQIWKLMKRLGRRILPVVQDGHLVGVVRARELSLLNAINVGSLDIRDVMHTNPCCVRQSDSLRAVIDAVSEGGYEYVVVLNDQDEVVEILSLNRILSALSSKCYSAEFGDVASIL